MKPLALAVTVALASSVSLAQDGPDVCGRIPYPDQRVACLRALSGHQVQDGAAQVCGTIPYPDEVVRCMEASVDRRYTASELGACRTIPYPDQKVECMRAAGRGARAPREEAAADASVLLENHTEETTVVRLYWRAAGRGPWTKVKDLKKVKPGRSVRVSFFAGTFDVCVETKNGASTIWRAVDVSGEASLSIEDEDDADSYGDVPCRDVR